MSDLKEPINTVGKQNRIGRPRTVCPEPEELKALGVEMVEWFNIHPDALHISEWYSLVKFFTDSTWESMKQKPEFLDYYEMAMKIVGKKYLDKTSNVREGASQRWQRVYYKDLRNQEDSDSKYHSALKKEENLHVTSPYQSTIDLSHENMKLKAEIAKLKELNDNKSEAR